MCHVGADGAEQRPTEAGVAACPDDQDVRVLRAELLPGVAAYDVDADRDPFDGSAAERSRELARRESMGRFVVGTAKVCCCERGRWLPCVHERDRVAGLRMVDGPSDGGVGRD